MRIIRGPKGRPNPEYSPLTSGKDQVEFPRTGAIPVRRSLLSGTDLRRIDGLHPLQAAEEYQQYSLLSVPEGYIFNVGTSFLPAQLPEQQVSNIQKKGSIKEIVGQDLSLYLIGSAQQFMPAVAVVSEKPVSSLEEIKALVQDQLDNGPIPIIHDLNTNMIIFPLMTTAKKTTPLTREEKVFRGNHPFFNRIRVAPAGCNHNDLLVYPLLLRGLIQEKGILNTPEEFNGYYGRLVQTDIFRNLAGQAFISALSDSIPRDSLEILKILGIVPIDEVERPEGKTTLESWLELYNVIRKNAHIPEYANVRALLYQTVYFREMREPSTSNMLTNPRDELLIAPNVFGGNAIKGDHLLSLDEVIKAEPLVQLSMDTHEAERGEQSRCVLLYKHPKTKGKYFLVIGGVHGETRDYTQRMIAKVSQNTAQLEEIAELSADLFFELRPLFKTSFQSNLAAVLLNTRLVMNRLQHRPGESEPSDQERQNIYDIISNMDLPSMPVEFSPYF